jgi:hypothetical protein
MKLEDYLTEFSMDWQRAIKYDNQTHLKCCKNCQYVYVADYAEDTIYCRNEENIKVYKMFHRSNSDIYVECTGICPKFKLDGR